MEDDCCDCERHREVEPADPNADLVGYTFPLEGNVTGKVMGSSVNEGYVIVRIVGSTLATLRVASQVRRRKMLEEA